MFVDKKIERILVKIGEEVKDRAKKLAPVVTGNLKNDIQVFDSKVSIGIIEIGNSKTASYAKFVHDGVKPYVVRRALKRGGVSEYKHPGIKANPYLARAVDDVIGRGFAVEKFLDSDFDEAIFKDLGLDKLGEVK